MPKTVQIRDLDDDVYVALRSKAAESGVSVPEFLRVEATRIAARPSMAAWVEELRANAPQRSSPRTREDTNAALDEIRGPWPDGDR